VVPWQRRKPGKPSFEPAPPVPAVPGDMYVYGKMMLSLACACFERTMNFL